MCFSVFLCQCFGHERCIYNNFMVNDGVVASVVASVVLSGEAVCCLCPSKHF